MAHHDIISPSLETLKILPESDEYEEVDVVEDSAPTPTEVDFKSESDIRQELYLLLWLAGGKNLTILPAFCFLSYSS